MPPHYVKAYVKRNKNDATDAEAICEAVTRPNMRFVAIKSNEQQSVLMQPRLCRRGLFSFISAERCRPHGRQSFDLGDFSTVDQY